MRARKLLERTGEHNPLPEGTIPVAVGLLVGGVTILGFLTISGRVLGPDRYAALSTLWLTVFVAAPGFFLPVEQELARALANRRARGVGGGPLVRRAAGLGAAMLAVLLVISAAGFVPARDELFHGENLLALSLMASLVGYFGAHLARGTLSGNGRFGPYGVIFGVEGVSRLAGCVVLAVAGVKSVGPYGLLVAVAPFVAIAIALPRQRGLVTPGPDAPWSELSTRMSLLLAGSVLTQSLVNAAPLTVAVLAGSDEKEVVGRFMAGVLIARVPLFMFQAVQAALLPKLAGLAGAGRYADFRSGLLRLLTVVIAIGGAGTLGAFTVGPWALRTFFNPDFELGRGDLGLLAAGSAAFMLAVTLGQALIALDAHGRAVLGWLTGLVAFGVVAALGSELLPRAEVGYVAGAFSAVCVMGIMAFDRMRHVLPEGGHTHGDLAPPDLIEP